MVNDRDWGGSQKLKGSRCRYSVCRCGLLLLSFHFTNMTPENLDGEGWMAADCYKQKEATTIAAAVLTAGCLLERMTHRFWFKVDCHGFGKCICFKSPGSEAVLFSRRWKTMYVQHLASEIYPFCCYFLQCRWGGGPAENKTGPLYWWFHRNSSWTGRSLSTPPNLQLKYGHDFLFASVDVILF